MKEQNIRHYLQKIVHGHTLSKSIVNKELLKYLVEQSIKNESPTEYQIAYDVLGKRGDSDKEKNIRVYIHNLRKKLNEYYESEGQSDEILFDLPKGGYNIHFSLNRKAYLRTRFNTFSPYLFISSILIFLLSLVLFFSKHKPTAAKQFIWHELSQSEFPTLIVLGDHYFFGGQSPMGGYCMMRVNNINSEQDLDKVISEHPEIEDKVNKTDQTYINKQAPFGLYKIMMLLGGGQADIELMFSSSFRWEHAKNRNVIFVGSFKTQNILKGVHEKIGIEYLVNESIVNFRDNDSTIAYNADKEGFLSVEYPTFSRFKTEDGRQIISFMSNKDVGVFGILNYLSVPDNLRSIETHVERFNTADFRAVLEVKGQGLTDFEVRLKNIKPIIVNINELWPR